MEDDQLRTRRIAALRDLINLRVPVDQAEAALAEFRWDSDHDLETLTRDDASRVLLRYQAGELTSADCERWAEALAGRDDLGFEQGWADTLKDFLFEIATPELAEPLTPEFSRRWRQRLTRSR
ncbi:MAG TPA: hypothetical protein VHZ97_11035 [Pseudonocardiaceae bacterium]|jgi:hypothetical protein|nr:hypothetical protein [Pseudonocardiaceae bacterium]